MIVYKYLQPERIDVLENGMIRFSQPHDLNDPFETNISDLDFRQRGSASRRTQTGRDLRLWALLLLPPPTPSTMTFTTTCSPRGFGR